MWFGFARDIYVLSKFTFYYFCVLLLLFTAAGEQIG